MAKLFTIGFTRKSARSFFGLLTQNGVKTLIDVRLNNTSQLAAFPKRDDLEYFLGEIGHISYAHVLEFAPTSERIAASKAGKASWERYAERFTALLTERKAESAFQVSNLDRA